MEGVVKFKKQLYELINTSGLTPIEIRYALEPVVNELNALLQAEEAAAEKVVRESNSVEEPKVETEDDTEITAEVE